MTIKYIDTRGQVKEPIPFTQAVLDGIAPGGGLYVPEKIPQLELSEILELANMPYAKQAAYIYKKFETDVPDSMIDRLMCETYGSQFDTPDICPITSLSDDMHVLELWHGPTSAFKDMALQCLPRFFSASARLVRERAEGGEAGSAADNNAADSTTGNNASSSVANNNTSSSAANNKTANSSAARKYMILTATSGDTGKAALEGFRDVDGVSIGVLYPDGGVSDIQYLQMATQAGGNVHVWGLRGNFDDCQTTAKAVFGDAAFAEKLLQEHNTVLSSANSINWGRLAPQIVYYVSAYARLAAAGKINAGQKIDVCVPTGNFGNILAAWYAREMGVPIAHTFCASNANHVLSDFIGGAPYDIQERDFILTPSPSMDILVSSNLERQLFECSGRDANCVQGWMNDLRTSKKFDIDAQTRARLNDSFKGHWVSNDTCLNTIKSVYEQHNYLLDPHTAVAYKTAQELREPGVPVLVASTAHWAKFGVNVYRALHDIPAKAALPADVAALSGCELNRLIAKETGGQIPVNLATLEDVPVRFKDVIDAGTDSVEAAACKFLSESA